MYRSRCLKSKLIQNGNLTPSIGLVILSTDLTCEQDFHFLACKHQLKFFQYVNRLRFANPVNEANLYAMLDDLTEVTAAIAPGFPLDLVTFCCTAGSAIIGDEAIENAIKNSRTDCKALTTALASVASMLEGGYKKISILAPYTKAVSTRLADYFESKGLDVSSLTYMDIVDDRDIAFLSSESIMQAAQVARDPKADAMFISCTAMRVVSIREQIEQLIDMPVFSSNYATFWQTMKQIGLA